MYNEFLWKSTWKEAQTLVHGTINLKDYGLKTSLDLNFSCPDFRCVGKVYSGECNNKHHERDPYYGTGLKFRPEELETSERITDPKLLNERLAGHLDKMRGTKAQALARFECWKQDTEHRLQYWNPFERKV